MTLPSSHALGGLPSLSPQSRLFASTRRGLRPRGAVRHLRGCRCQSSPRVSERAEVMEASPSPPAALSKASSLSPTQQPAQAANALEGQQGESVEVQQPTLLPKLLLLLVAMLWGSYAPSLRLVYTSPDPPDAVVVMAVRGVLQSAVLLLASAASSQGGPEQQQQQQQQQASRPSDSSEGGGEAGSLLEAWLTLRSPPLWMAALELGLWNYMATALQTFGLTLTSATRASFLIQATALLTPLLASLAGQRPSQRVWAGCGLALAGTLAIAGDKAAVASGGAAGDVAAAAASFHLGGDAAILFAALFYSLATVRITGYAQSLPPVQIATGKSLVLCGAALATLLAAAVAGSGAAAAASGGDGGGGMLGSIVAMWPGWQNPVVWAALAWSAVGPGALAAWLHVQGQRDVQPAEAQVIFSSVPLWSAAFAWVLLGGEQLGPLTWVGGGALVGAGLLASIPTTAAAAGEQQQQGGAAHQKKDV